MTMPMMSSLRSRGKLAHREGVGTGFFCCRVFDRPEVPRLEVLRRVLARVVFLVRELGFLLREVDFILRVERLRELELVFRVGLRVVLRF
jgi:hypothetical protein